MIFKILMQYILGYVNISVEGYYIERFINICISKEIFIWNVKREKSTYMKANVGIQDYKKLKEVSKKTKCRMKIHEKRGVPFLMNRYRKRKIFGILLVVLIITMYITSKFVWNIEIEGVDKIQKEEMMNELDTAGLSIGTFKNRINPSEIINAIRLNRDDIAWMNIDLKGTNVIVKIVEKTKKPEIVKADEYCNIIASKKAQITKITAKNGTILVKVRGYCYGKYYINWWMDGRELYWSKICACRSER